MLFHILYQLLKRVTTPSLTGVVRGRSALFILLLLSACTSHPTDQEKTDALPPIYPDYIGVTIPVGIAPLNFSVEGNDVERVDVTVTGQNGAKLHTNGKTAQFDIEDWHQLLEENKGSELRVSVCAKENGKWKQYQDFTITVSSLPLDEWGLTYRRIAPGYEVYSHMGIYQRNLSNFDEEAIIDNTQVPGACFNCHTANRTNPKQMVFHVRGENGATVMQIDGKREILKASNETLGGSMVYPYWHPSGEYCAFSTNTTRQSFHVVPDERIEVFDLASDILVYHPKTHEILTDSLISRPDWSENTPVFSPDGKTLYFLTCQQQKYPSHFKDEKYNLCKIAFDPATGHFGNHVDTVFNAVGMGKSLTWPRPSYDGKYLLFTLMDYGYFSIWHKESEQWLMNLSTGESRNLSEINSDDADSYHNWSANSHWIVFTSRRGDGLYTRLYLSSIDEKGHFSKPFLLPQKNPKEYYNESLYSFNTPDFTNTHVSFNSHLAAQEILSPRRIETKMK